MGEMTIVVENGGEVRRDLANAEKVISQQVQDDAIEEFGKELKKEIERTAPVRTGRYVSNWELVEVDDGYYLINDTPYAKYLVFPNSRMQGSPKADDPGRGIIHNVRGIVFRRKSSFREKIASKVKKLLSVA